MNVRAGAPGVAGVGLCLLTVVLGGATDVRAARVDPTGLWYCLIYGPGQYDDVYVSVRLDGDGGGEMSWGIAARNRYWRPLSNVTMTRRSLAFSDPATGRNFESDLSLTTLGGSWRGGGRAGGWWCAPQPAAVAARSDRLRNSAAVVPVPVPLASIKMEAPRYPVQAIREAKEGRAVVCFFVDRKGSIVDPELVELSDEVFGEPSLRALAASRFEEADSALPLRPGCRSYVYSLDPVR